MRGDVGAFVARGGQDGGRVRGADVGGGGEVEEGAGFGEGADEGVAAGGVDEELVDAHFGLVMIFHGSGSMGMGMSLSLHCHG